MAYCSKCGAQIPEDAAFCPVCGTPTETVTTPQKPLPVQSTQPPLGVTPIPVLPMNLVLAGWGTRFLAWLIDVIILGVVLSPVNSIGLNLIPTAPWFPLANFGLSNIVHLLYWTLMEGYMGQSVGKIALGIKVTNIQGGQPTIIEAAIESFGKAFLLPLDLIIGWILYPKTRQRLFTYLSHSIVVRK
jgi:uncharacterized RDD family membrane protein YckC